MSTTRATLRLWVLMTPKAISQLATAADDDHPPIEIEEHDHDLDDRHQETAHGSLVLRRATAQTLAAASDGASGRGPSPDLTGTGPPT